MAFETFNKEGKKDAIDCVRKPFVEHLTELDFTPTELRDDYLQELMKEGFLNENGFAFAAHNKAITEEQVKLVDDAAKRFETTQAGVATYIDINKILTVVINPIIN